MFCMSAPPWWPFMVMDGRFDIKVTGICCWNGWPYIKERALAHAWLALIPPASDGRLLPPQKSEDISESSQKPH